MTVIEQLLVTLQRESDFLLALAAVDADGRPRVRTMKGTIDKQLIIRCALRSLQLRKFARLKTIELLHGRRVWRSGSVVLTMSTMP